MHFLAISLLAILAGILLLAKFKKDGLGKFFSFISWFFIVVGFVLFIGFIAGGIYRMSHFHKMCPNECRQEMMMRGPHHGFWGPEQAPCCMKHDSMMKPSCCKHMVDDTTKKMVPPPKVK